MPLLPIWADPHTVSEETLDIETLRFFRLLGLIGSATHFYTPSLSY